MSTKDFKQICRMYVNYTFLGPKLCSLYTLFFDKEKLLLMRKYVIHQLDEESQEANKDSYNITFQLLLHISSRKQCSNNSCALTQSDAKKTTLEILIFLSNHIDHKWWRNKLPTYFKMITRSQTTMVNQKKISNPSHSKTFFNLDLQQPLP